MLKSKISDHTATVNEVLTRASDVVNCGILCNSTAIGSTMVAEYTLWRNKYVCTIINSELRYFELEHVYLFEL